LKENALLYLLGLCINGVRINKQKTELNRTNDGLLYFRNNTATIVI